MCLYIYSYIYGYFEYSYCSNILVSFKSMTSTAGSTSRNNMSLMNTSLALNSTFDLPLNESFDLSFWLGNEIKTEYTLCRNEFVLHFNDSKLILQSQENQDYIEKKCHQTRAMQRLFLIISVSVGVPANIIALVALSTLKPRSIGLFYIALLTAADLAALVMRCWDFLMATFHVDTHKYICGLRATLVNFFPTLANWLLVLIVFERFYALRFPFSKAVHFTFDRARLLVSIVALLLFSYNASRIFTYGESVRGFCKEKHQSIKNITGTIDRILLFYFPLILIFIFVALVAHGLYLAQQTRERIFSSASFQQAPAGGGHGDAERSIEDNRQTRQGSEQPLNEHTSHMLRKQRRNERSLTIMMFSAAIFFVVMILPLIIVLNTKPHIEMGVAEMNYKFNLILTQGLSLLTHAANFFLYFLTCRRLRRHLWKLLRLGKIRKLSIANEEAEMTKMSRVPESEMAAACEN